MDFLRTSSPGTEAAKDLHVLCLMGGGSAERLPLDLSLGTDSAIDLPPPVRGTMDLRLAVSRPDLPGEKLKIGCLPTSPPGTESAEDLQLTSSPGTEAQHDLKLKSLPGDGLG